MLPEDRFFVYGRVHPSSYDWRAQFAEVARSIQRSGHASIPLDAGKIMGLCSYIDELEARVAALEGR